MRIPIFFSSLSVVSVLSAAATAAEAPPTARQFLSPASPQEVVAARRADRIAWVDYAEGKRNAYTAAAPHFTPVRLTSFDKDDGIMMSEVQISDDGGTVVFLRGEAPNAEGWSPDPTADPNGPEHAIWAAHANGVGGAWRVVDADNPELAPDGSSLLFVKNGQIYRAKVAPAKAAAAVDRGEKPFISEWGVQSDPKWSPDGRKIAWVSTRSDHSFVMVYDLASRSVKYMSPSVDFDTAPMWLPDSRRLVFVRTPGLPFGRGPLQKNAPAFTNNSPGLMRATFKGGYTLSLYKADATTGNADEIWHNQPSDPVASGFESPHLAGDYIVFSLPTANQPATDPWDRYYSLNITNPLARPVLLTPTNGLIEDGNSIAFSADGKTFYYCTNAGDLERRHIWAVPVSGGIPVQITTGEGVETRPTPLPSGKYLATLSANWNMPQSIGVWKTDTLTAAAPAQKIAFPTSTPGFPVAAHVKPEIVLTRAADGLEIHNQLFLPKDLKPGERRPAIVFVHGGPMREMMPAYHYMQFYHWAYGINQWLASQGYIVLSINYRGGIGYGRAFRDAPKTGAAGNSEYQDVLAGGKYLQGRPDVDPSRIGIWGLSYGGQLTSEALARNSDIFKAGVDLAGVHLLGTRTLDPEAVSYKSSSIGEIDHWKSPVLLIQGDDDRNVSFAQTVGLVQLLRQRDIYYELIVFPDDVHESLLHSRWLYTLSRIQTFLQKFLRDRQ